MEVSLAWSSPLHRSTELMPVDKEPNDGIVDRDGFGETDCLADQVLDPGTRG